MRNMSNLTRTYFILIFCIVFGFALSVELSNLEKQKLSNLVLKYNLKVSDKLNENFRRAQSNADYFNQRYNGSANFGITEYALMSQNEVENHFSDINMDYFQSNLQTIPSNVSVDIPTSFDYRMFGKVSAVKSQGHCGSCYAFAAVAAIESYYLIHFNKSLDLSEQFALSCGTRSAKCNGGSISDILNVSKTVGIPSEACDPYIQAEENCSNEKCKKERFFIDNYQSYGRDENQIAKNLYLYGPATFCFFVPLELLYYTGGVLDAPAETCNKNNSVGGHCMVLVGYTPEYWIAKNSKGILNGENGFVRFKRFQNFCGFTAGVYGPTKNNSIVTFGTKVFSTTTSLPSVVSTKCPLYENKSPMNQTTRNYVLYHWNGRRSQIAKGQFQLTNNTIMPSGKNINKLEYNCTIEAMLRSYDLTCIPPKIKDWNLYTFITKQNLTTMQNIYGIADLVSHINEEYTVTNLKYINSSYIKSFANDDATSIACWPTTNECLTSKWSIICGMSPIRNANVTVYTIGPACKVNSDCTKKGYNKCDPALGLCFH